MNLTAHLRELVAAHGPCGHEGPVREVIRNTWEPLVDEFQQDGLGSLIGIRRANSGNGVNRRIMLAAHMDEIAMMVRENSRWFPVGSGRWLVLTTGLHPLCRLPCMANVNCPASSPPPHRIAHTGIACGVSRLGYPDGRCGFTCR